MGRLTQLQLCCLIAALLCVAASSRRPITSGHQSPPARQLLALVSGQGHTPLFPLNGRDWLSLALASLGFILAGAGGLQLAGCPQPA